MAEGGEIDYDSIPARALNVSSRNLLSKLLNPQMEIPTSKYLCKDYRGLAELMNFDYPTIRSFEATGNPTKRIFEEWEVLPNSTIGKLKMLLEEIERFDVIDDMQFLIEQDVRSYLSRNQRVQEAPLQVAEISSELFVSDDSSILTVDDLYLRNQNGGAPEVAFFDAYVCYAEEDAPFVFKLAEYLEKQEIGIKLFIKERNLLFGADVYETLVKLIEERCNRMLVILTPEFLLSEECKFLARYGAGLAIAQLKRKMIPLVFKPCEIPCLLRFVSKLDFTKSFISDWTWRNLLVSIKSTVSSTAPVPSNNYCQPLYVASLMSSSYDVPMLPAPSQNMQTRSNGPQPSISFPPSTTYSLPSNASVASLTLPMTSSSSLSSTVSVHSTAVPTTSSSSQSKTTTSTSRSKLAKFMGKFTSLSSSSSSSSSSHSSATNNSSSGFQSDSNIVFSDEYFEEVI